MEEEFLNKKIYYYFIKGEVTCKSHVIECDLRNDYILSHGYEFNKFGNDISSIEYLWMDNLLK